MTVLAIVEDWCPDVIANLPIFARIEEVVSVHRPIAGALSVREHEGARQRVIPALGDRSHIPTLRSFSAGSVVSSVVLIELVIAITRTKSGTTKPPRLS